MVRLFNAYFPGRTLFLGISETGLMVLSFVLATFIWVGSDAGLVLAYEGGFTNVVIVTLVLLVCMYYFDLYDNLVLTNQREVITRVIQVAGASSLLLAILYYGFPSLRLPFSLFATGVTLFVILLVWWRYAFFWTCRSLNLYHRLLLLGDGKLANAITDELKVRPEAGFQVMGYVNPSGSSEGHIHLPFLGDITTLRDVVKQHHIDQVVIALGDRRGRLPIEELLKVKANGVNVIDAADMYEALTGKLPVDSLRLSWLLFSSGFGVTPAVAVYKRLFSLAASAVMLVIASPLMLLIAVAIRIDSPGPVIFRQQRIGQNGKAFTLFKFRSMFDGSDARSTRPAETDDERFTRVGKWIRRLRVDELPQLFNILLGDMAFVGPRPFVPEQEEECVKHIPFYSQRWTVKPGATGWAQVNRGYCASIEDNIEKLSYDLFYIKNMSIGLDLLIVFKTIKTLLLGRGGR